MNFWQQIQTAAEMKILPWLVLIFIVALLILFVVKPSERMRLRTSLLLFAFSVVNVAGVFVFEVLLESLRLKPPRIMRDLLQALGYVVAAITILSKYTDLTGIIATSAVLTAIIGLSFQDTLGNMMGGMALQMERTIGVGDWIRIDGQEGMVKEIRWRHTAIETRNWDTIVIPNSALM